MVQIAGKVTLFTAHVQYTWPSFQLKLPQVYPRTKYFATLSVWAKQHDCRIDITCENTDRPGLVTPALETQYLVNYLKEDLFNLILLCVFGVNFNGFRQ